MATEVMETPLQYLDRAMGAIKELGIWPEQEAAEQPITGLLSQITDLDETKVILIGRTLTQASASPAALRSFLRCSSWAVAVSSSSSAITSACFSAPRKSR